MLPTPSTSHVNTDRIYDPSEDSFLFLDTLSSKTEVDFLTERFAHTGDNRSRVPLILEVGTGSGVILAFLTANAKALLGTAEILTLGTDINHFACEDSQPTISKACKDQATGSSGRFLDVLHADLAAPLRTDMVDVLICNPPYVPSGKVPVPTAPLGSKPNAPGYMTDAHLLSMSYEGGKQGMEVADRLLKQLPHVLNKERGVAYILLCQQNQPDKVVESLRGLESDWTVDVVGMSGRHAGWEKLQILRISHGKLKNVTD